MPVERNNYAKHFQPITLPLLVALIGALGAAPLLLDAGFLNTRHLGDSPFLLFRTQQLYSALADGAFPPRWMPDAAYGLGYPFFHYYAALPFYLAAGLHALGLSLVWSLKLTALAGFVVAAWGMYGWVYAMTGRRAGALLAALAYTVAPYHLLNVYLRGDALSEFWAMAWYPLILWALHAAAEHPTRPRLAAVAVSFGALVLTHNVSALIFAPFVAVYALGLALPGGPRRVLTLAGAGLLGLALAAWFWFPALNETDAVQLDGQAEGFFFYGEHFRAGDLLQSAWVFDYTVLGEDANAQSVGRAQGLLMGLGALVVLLRLMAEKRVWREVFIVSGLGVSLFMVTPQSEWLWANLPLLALAQFPWRFLSIVALFGAASTAALADLPGVIHRNPSPTSPRIQGDAKHAPIPSSSRIQGELEGGKLRTAMLIAVGVGLVLSYTGLARLDTDFIPITDADITPARLHAYESFTGSLGTTIGGEYLPRGVDEPPHTSDLFLGQAPRAQFFSGGGEADRLSAQSHRQTWRVRVDEGGASVAFPLHYWPGWGAEADGQALDLVPVQGMGYSLVNLPAGDYDLTLALGRPAARLIPELISWAALLALLGLAWPALRRLPARPVLFGAGAGLVIVLSLGQLPEPDSNRDLVTADFAQRALHHPGPVTYRDGARWLAGEVTHDADALRWSLTWDAPPDQLRVELAPPLGLINLGAPLYPLATPTPDDATFSAVYSAEMLAPGVYFPRLTRYPSGADTRELTRSIDALTEHGYGRGPLHLNPVILPPGHARLPDALQEADPVSLADLRLYGTTSDVSLSERARLLLTLWWRAEAELRLHYGVDLAILDANGNEWIRFNALAGNAGMHPTGLWRPGAVVPDAYRIDIPAGMPPGDYRARVSLYDPGTLATLATNEIDGVRQPYTTPLDCDAPRGEALTDALFLTVETIGGEALQGTPLPVMLRWAATAPPEVERLRWMLIPAVDGPALTLSTPLAPGSAADDWDTASGCGADVRARHALPIPADVAPGDYRLMLGMGDASRELGAVRILEQTRLLQVPDLDTPLAVDFEDGLRLWGYSLSQSPDAIALDLAWGASTPPGDDYRVFVHLYPADDLARVVAQHDRIPADYPTSRWMAGEVVPDGVTFDPATLPPGEYVIGLGWYLPGPNTRLAILQAAPGAEALPDARVILPARVTVP